MESQPLFKYTGSTSMYVKFEKCYSAIEVSYIAFPH